MLNVKISRCVNYAKQQHWFKKKHNWICKSHRRQTADSSVNRQEVQQSFSWVAAIKVNLSILMKMNWMNSKQTNECTNYASTGIKLPKSQRFSASVCWHQQVLHCRGYNDIWLNLLWPPTLKMKSKSTHTGNCFKCCFCTNSHRLNCSNRKKVICFVLSKKSWTFNCWIRISHSSRTKTGHLVVCT